MPVGLMVIVNTSDPVRPPLSVAVAVITCVPCERVLRVKGDPPGPNVPSILDVHTKLALTSPSSGSEAVAAKVRGSPVVKTDRSAGEVIVTVGA